MDALSDRNLLFGLLALQNGMIDPSALVVAFGTWTRDHVRSLAEILVDQGAIDEEDRVALMALAARHLKRHEGEAGPNLEVVTVDVDFAVSSTLPEGPARRADHDPFATVVPTPSSQSLETRGWFSSEVAGDGNPVSSGEAHRFRILRPHARGGLGEVFVAVDDQLKREVALKQILDRHADDPQSRTRFVLEAEITGGLEHPGIVPVYGLGSDGDGRLFYAMRFIRGESLKEAIAAFQDDEALRRDPGRRSLALRKLLRRFVDVCNAIDYAHGRGVLHRDLKPANVILGKHGETLVVDWGLAKAMGKSDPDSATGELTLRPSTLGGSTETLHGSAIGTPAYMSPEQAVGDLDRLGPRSDVYSLGATLYCLLTGRAPFEGTDLLAILKAVREGDFPPPRRVVSSVDRVLEAVCLKAMATHPEARHASARLLADDIEQWAADEPVSAWREPASVVARRWMRRHRTAVMAASAAWVVALVGLAGVLAVQSGANRALLAKNRELDRANLGLVEANNRVQDRFNLAREALRSLQAVASDDLLKGEGQAPLRNKLLRTAAGFYQKLEEQLRGQADTPSLKILAQAYFELGELTDQLGIKPEALADHRKALALRRTLAGRPDADPEIKLDLARSLVASGKLARSTGESDGVLEAYREARDLVEPLTTGSGTSRSAREVLGGSYLQIQNILDNRGDVAGAHEANDRATAVFRKLAEDNPEVASYRKSLVWCRLDRENWKWDDPRKLQAYREAVAAFRGLAREDPTCRDDLASSLDSFSNMLANSTQFEEALSLNREALAIRRALARESPAATSFRRDLAFSLNIIGYNQIEAGRLDEAMASMREALGIARRLAEDDPSDQEYQYLLAFCFEKISRVQAKANLWREALDSKSEERATRRLMVEKDPTIHSFRRMLAENLHSSGKIQEQLGQPAEALASFREASKIYLNLIGDAPNNTDYHELLALSNGKIVKNLATAGDAAGALEEHLRSLKVESRLPETADTIYNRACMESILAGCFARVGSTVGHVEADALAVRAVSTLGRAITLGFRDLAHMRQDTDLDPIRNRPDFQSLMLDLAFPAWPFADPPASK